MPCGSSAAASQGGEIVLRHVFVAAASGALISAPLVSIAPVADAATPRCHGQRATIVGTDGPDVLRGTAGPDVIVALAGDDRIKGLGGNDVICGGPGDDRLYGTGGSDWIRGAGGRDLLMGGSGADRLWGGDRADDIEGGMGPDWFMAGAGRDFLLDAQPEAAGARFSGGPGTDRLRIHGHAVFSIDLRRHRLTDDRGVAAPYRGIEEVQFWGHGTLHFWGGPGDDAADTEGARLVAHGGRGDDALSGSMKNDMLVGGPGDDRAWGGHGTDVCLGFETIADNACETVR